MIVLGIDIGTTSVKVALVHRGSVSTKVLASTSECHKADISLAIHTRAEQDPSLICIALEKCVINVLEKVDFQTVTSINSIVICGQMHGCMLWNPVRPDKKCDFYPCSTLITWQDQRCDLEFLNSLPQPERSLPISAGFGCATLFWMERYAASEIKKYTCAGTIMDYISASLCRLEKPIMSTHNAMSWGYYDFCDEEWNVRILQESGFDTRLLPDIAQPGTAIGTLYRDWIGIPAGTKIVVALGDMQCSVLSCNPSPLTGVFNLSTSAQLSTVSQLHYGRRHYQEKNRETDPVLPDSLVCVPYFNDLCLWTSPSLNGGTVFEMFSRALYDWTKKFAPSVTMDQIYSQLQKSENKEDDAPSTSQMRIYPTVFGERHAPETRGFIENITFTDISVSNIAEELARGIIRNTFQMFRNAKTKPDFGNLTAILGCGSAFEKNRLFREALQEIAGVPCSFDRSMDAAFGATVAVDYPVCH